MKKILNFEISYSVYEMNWKCVKKLKLRKEGNSRSTSSSVNHCHGMLRVDGQQIWAIKLIEKWETTAWSHIQNTGQTPWRLIPSVVQKKRCIYAEQNFSSVPKTQT